MKVVFENLCPNCKGEITDVELSHSLPCKECYPSAPSSPFPDLVLEVGRYLEERGKLLDYEELYRVEKELRKFDKLFESFLGDKPWSAQRTWAKRVIRGKSFAITAPTGLGKTTFAMVISKYIAERGGRAYIVLPTSVLVKQVGERLEGSLYYHSGMRKSEKEAFMKRLEEGTFSVLITTSQFLSRNFERLKKYTFDLVVVDDVDSILKSSKNVDRVLMLLGFGEKEIEVGMELIRERIRVARGRGDPDRVRTLEKWLEKRKGKRKGILVVSSATVRPRGLRYRLFRELLDFEVGSGRAQVRRVVNYRTDDYLGVIRAMGWGGIVLVSPFSGKSVDEVIEEINEIGLRAERGSVDSIERFRKGETDVLVGSASYYGVLVRGIDIPERVKYVVFVGVPHFEFPLSLEDISPLRLAFLLRIAYEVTNNRELRVLSNRIRRYGREEDVNKGKELLSTLLRDEEFVEALNRTGEVVIREGKILLPDYRTYIQGSGRASRMYAGGITKGLSALYVDDEELFQMLRRYLVSLYGEDFEEDLDLISLREELERERERIRKGGRTEDPVRTVLFIVESPNKARTIARFFGRPSVIRKGSIRGYEVTTGKYILNVVATVGHMFDLTVGRGFHGVENVYIPVYTTIKRCLKCGTQTVEQVCPRCGTDEFLEDAIERVSAIREMAYEADTVIVGTDPDTEGEKIGWDVMLALRPFNANVWRSEFHEVTRRSILEALENVREFNEHRVNAQIVRRIEDRWIGFELSQKLWVVFGNRRLSAGRVQTPVLGWIIERYGEHKRSVRTFVEVVTEAGRFLFKTDMKPHDAKSYAESNRVRIKKVRSEEKEVSPPPPFTTDTLIWEAGRRTGWGAKKIMDLAQQLFEMGLITYHRTDSTRVSPEGMVVAREYIERTWGEEFVKLRTWGEGGAHECIRPTRPLDARELVRYIEEGEIVVEGITRDHIRLYSLIFDRFVRSQMREADVREALYEIAMNGWKTEEERIEEIRFPGWMVGREASPLPEGVFPVKDVRVFRASEVPLYTQSDVVRLMKERGIGRPSTYATIVQKLLERRYVLESRKKNRLYPTPLGIKVYSYLSSKFPDLVSEERTRLIEELMDKIERGEEDYRKVLEELYREIMSTRGII